MKETKTRSLCEADEVSVSRKLPAFLKKLAYLLAILLAIVLFIRLYVPWLYYHRLYWGDRIKGNVTVTVDGQPAKIEKDNTFCSFGIGEEDCATTDFRITDDGMFVATKANEYGAYDYTFSVEELSDTEFRFLSYQFNWWNVTEFELHYHIDTEANLVTYEAECVYLLESGKKSEPENHTGSYALNGEPEKVYVCSP